MTAAERYTKHILYLYTVAVQLEEQCDSESVAVVAQTKYGFYMTPYNLQRLGVVISDLRATPQIQL